MPQRQTTYQTPYEGSERTAVVERDLYHLDQRLNHLTVAVDAAHGRLHALSKRIERTEWQLDATTSSLEGLRNHTSQMNDKLPDLEATLRIMRWIVDSAKYLLAAAIIAGTFASGSTMALLRALFD